MANQYYDLGGGLRRAHTSTSDPPVNHSRKSWTNNGVHYTVETTSFATPGISFGAFQGSVNSPLRSSFGPGRTSRANRGPGLLGAAFGLLGNVLSAHTHEHSSNPKPRSRSYPTDTFVPRETNSRAARVENYTDSEDSDQDDYDEELIESLENAAAHHRRAARSCRKRLEQASKQRNVNTAVLQALVNELKTHEDAQEDALDDLERAKNGVSSRAPHRDAPRRTQSSQHRAPPSMPDNDFAMPFPTDDFETFFQTRRTPRAATFNDFDTMREMPFSAFHSLFDDFNSFGLNDGFFGMPRAAFTGNQGAPRATSFGGQSKRPSYSYTTVPQAPPRPPANLLGAEEAKRLFRSYNDRWNALAPTDPNIPYPARGLKPNALRQRDSIWAPTTSSPVSTWSEEAVMQANVQAFFLGAVGLTPLYTEAPGTGRVLMTYDKTRATPAQVKELTDILKKEKVRWHSDRLGRRHAGMEGPNEALQNDDRARAVFHAVRELMDAA